MCAEHAELPITSSNEPIWADEARACYSGVLEELARTKVPFAVSGGFAFHHHTGIWRATKDLDLVITPAEAPKALNILMKAGFETWVEDPVWLAKAQREGYFVDLITGVGNATLTVEDDWIERAIPDQMLGTPCKVLGAEEMIASKLFVTRRERFDGADIAHLLKARAASLDWDRLRLLTEKHWEILYWHFVLFAFIYPGLTDLVPQKLWRELTEEFAQSVLRPDGAALFRGSLIDPRMFAIDVKEWGEPDLYRELWDHYPHRLEAGNASGRL